MYISLLKWRSMIPHISHLFFRSFWGLIIRLSWFWTVYSAAACLVNFNQTNLWLIASKTGFHSRAAANITNSMDLKLPARTWTTDASSTKTQSSPNLNSSSVSKSCWWLGPLLKTVPLIHTLKLPSKRISPNHFMTYISNGISTFI
jgi:hypothetical protein